MQVDQGLLSMLASSNQRDASASTSVQPASGDQDVKMSDSASKGSEGPDSSSKTPEDDSMDIVRRERERETPDTTTKPEGKALKTSSAASSKRKKQRRRCIALYLRRIVSSSCVVILLIS